MKSCREDIRIELNGQQQRSPKNASALCNDENSPSGEANTERSSPSALEVTPIPERARSNSCIGIPGLDVDAHKTGKDKGSRLSPESSLLAVLHNAAHGKSTSDVNLLQGGHPFAESLGITRRLSQAFGNCTLGRRDQER